MLTEEQPLRSVFTLLNLQTCRGVALSLVSYLSSQDIEAVEEALRGQGQDQFLVGLFRNLRFINKYINATDKSLYFTFCDEPEYKNIEIEQTAAVSQQRASLFLSYDRALAAVNTTLKQKVPVLQQEMSGLLEMLVNPDLPLPKLKRETQGMYCTSPFQLFLVETTFSQPEEDLFTVFEALKKFLSLEKEEEYLKQFILILKDKTKGGTDLKKIIQVRYTPYEITAGNITDFLLENNELHNFIVGLFAMTDTLLEAVHDYVRLIADPLHRLVELTLRYNIYRNYVLAVEEFLPFVFGMYDNIYRETIEVTQTKPKYNFWRPALTKWFLRMDHLHTEAQQVYMHCLTKLRSQKLKEAIVEQCSQDQLRFGRLLQSVEASSYEYELAQKICTLGTGDVSVFFERHPENYEVVVMEFNDYLVDISVNEQTVHWCGHSQHQLEQPYLDYEQALMKMSHDYIASVVDQGQPLSKQDIFEIVRIDAEYISTLQIKNRTLKKLYEAVNEEYQLEGETSLRGDFEEADGKLEYFNHKALILAVVDENSRPFYSIPPHCSPEKIIDMIDTNDSSSSLSDSDNLEYESESEEQHTTQPENSNRPEKGGKRQTKRYDSDEQSDQVLSPKLSGGKREIKTKKVFYDEEAENNAESMVRSTESREEAN